MRIHVAKIAYSNAAIPAGAAVSVFNAETSMPAPYRHMPARIIFKATGGEPRDSATLTTNYPVELEVVDGLSLSDSTRVILAPGGLQPAVFPDMTSPNGLGGVLSASINAGIGEVSGDWQLFARNPSGVTKAIAIMGDVWVGDDFGEEYAEYLWNGYAAAGTGVLNRPLWLGWRTKLQPSITGSFGHFLQSNTGVVGCTIEQLLYVDSAHSGSGTPQIRSLGTAALANNVVTGPPVVALAGSPHIGMAVYPTAATVAQTLFTNLRA